jgi:hypothetical protein
VAPGNEARRDIWSFPMNKTDRVDLREVPTVISDSGQLRIGSLSPAFPPVRSTGTELKDTGKVRIGSLSPAFTPTRTK